MPAHQLMSRRSGERGQTLILVAVAIVSLLGMAALAIDVVTLYVARTELQRAADAAALAGAKAIADSGITNLNAGGSSLYQNAVETNATAMMREVIKSNLVAGAVPTFPAPAYNFTQPNDPIVTVTLQRTSLPVFFAKIWGQKAASVSASASAEVYSPTGMANYTPIAPRCVKPWLVGNNYLVGATTGNYVTNGVVDTTVIGSTATLTPACGHTPGNCSPPSNGSGLYLPALTTPNSSNICSSCAKAGTAFEQSIGCCDANPYSCGIGTASWDNTVNPNVPAGSVTENGGQCLIHQTGPPPGIGQDTLVLPSGTYPPGPAQITAQSGPQVGKLVTTSSSIVTLPIIDNNVIPPPPAAGPVNVLGFMQGFINFVGPDGKGNNGVINLTILNIAGCSTTPNASAPVVGSGASSPVPIRLIAP